MRLFRAAGLRAVDAAAADTGIETYALMRTAGAAVVAALARHWPAARHVCVLCGPGNNGGDGYVAAELLGREGRQVSVLELRSDPSGADAGRARADLLAAALDAVRIDGPDARAPTDGSDVVIDALFGSGLTRDLEGVAARWAHEVTRAGTPVLAVDVPSGVRADRAGLSGPILRAHATLQLAGATIASALAPARAAFGAWEVADIGLPERLLDEHAAGRLLDHDDVAAAFAPPEDDVHKYLAGTVLVVGGSRRYAGAAELAARGALRAGAGLVTLASEASATSGWPEFVREPFEIGAAAACIEAVGA
nr:NAD(P)H-hydrate epimerase [Trueperaceae bacterium]